MNGIKLSNLLCYGCENPLSNPIWIEYNEEPNYVLPFHFHCAYEFAKVAEVWNKELKGKSQQELYDEGKKIADELRQKIGSPFVENIRDIATHEDIPSIEDLLKRKKEEVKEWFTIEGYLGYYKGQRDL